MLTPNYRKEAGSRNSKQRNYEDRNYGGMVNNNNSYLSSQDIGGGDMGGGLSARRANEYKMTRNESKNSANFNKEQIRNQQNRLMKLNNENYVIESPDIGHRKVNNKVGVQLAPLS